MTNKIKDKREVKKFFSIRGTQSVKKFDACTRQIFIDVQINSRTMIAVTANRSLTLFFKQVCFLAALNILLKLDLRAEVKGVEPRNKIVIHKAPQLALVDDTFPTSAIIRLLISGKSSAVMCCIFSSARAELLSHWLKKNKISKTKGIKANNVKKEIEALVAKKLCRLKLDKIS